MIYFDNAATTKISGNVLNAMMPHLTENYGNASSIYTIGRESAIALAKARADCAEALGCEPREIFFTSGGSESNNWAIKSIALQMRKNKKNHIISSAFEHHAVLHVLETLQEQGFDVTYLPVNPDGIVKTDDLSDAIRPDTGLVTIMYANNEIGTIQPVPEIGQILAEKNIPFHTDAVQAIGNVKINVKEQNTDMLSLSGHKIHAMKGVGLLYVNKKIRLAPFIEGGAQERGLRAGTENIAGIAGLAEALKTAVSSVEKKREKLIPMQNKLAEEIMKIPRVRLNGDRYNRLPSTLNFSFEGVEGESLLLNLDLKGIMTSSGSACTSGSLDPSHVLLALGLSHETAHGSLRISMSSYNTMEEVDEFLRVLPPVIEKLRGMSPLWDKLKK